MPVFSDIRLAPDQVASADDEKERAIVVELSRRAELVMRISAKPPSHELVLECLRKTIEEYNARGTEFIAELQWIDGEQHGTVCIGVERRKSS